MYLARFLLVLLLACVVLTEKGIANESWGALLFPTKRHDFGHVVLGANAEFRFELTNVYNSDIGLASVRSSCSCASARFSSHLLRPGETGAVIARLNTSGQHLRNKSAVLTVQLETVSQGVRRLDTVQLFVSGYIRPDVVLTPGSIEFGAVAEGTTAERTVQLEYTGRSGWALMKVERSHPFVSARAEEIRRTRGDVVYRITATLREGAPVGYIRDVLRFTTNEVLPGRAEPSEIVLPIQGVVTAPIRAKPSPVFIGILAPGEVSAKNLIIRGEAPFRITDISAPDSRFRFAFSSQESVIQLVSVSFSAGLESTEPMRDIAETIRISTNDPQQGTITVDAFVRVVSRPVSPTL